MKVALVAFALMRLGMRLEAGPEYDSNSNHVETPAPGSADPAPVPSFLVRATARGKLAWTTRDSSLRLALDLGTKLFFAGAAQPQDVLAGRLGAEGRIVRGPMSYALALDYHDTWQWTACPPVVVGQGQDQHFDDDTSCHRDFRLVAVRGSATLRDGIPSITAELGARSYEWKPDNDWSFIAAGTSVTPAARFHGGPGADSEWTLSATGRIEWRQFAGPARTSATDTGADLDAPRRHDMAASLGVNASFAGPIIVSAGWFAEATRSSSFAQSLLYQSVALDVVAPLPARFTIAGRGQLLFFTRGRLANAYAVEDENRDAFMLDLARDFGAGFTVRARYSFFRSAPGDVSQGYLRHVGTLALTYQTK